MVDTPYCDSMPWADMAYETFDAHAVDFEQNPESFMNVIPASVPSYLAASNVESKEDLSVAHQYAQAYPPVEESIEEQRGNNWMGYRFQAPWNTLGWAKSEQSAAVPAWTETTESLGMMRTWENEEADEGSKRWEKYSAADPSPMVNSIRVRWTTVICPSCQKVFTGTYSKGNFSRHMRTKHDSHRRGGRIRHGRLAYSIFLTGAQLACTIPLHSYDHCHGDPACRPPIASISALDSLPPYFDFLKHPTTNVFVLSALAYGATAMRQYHINDQDRFQQMCLVIGVTMGFFWSVASPAGLSATSSTMAMAITAALSVSTIGHWMYAMARGENMRTEEVAVEEKVGKGVV